MIKSARHWLVPTEDYFDKWLERAEQSSASKWHGKPFKFMVQDVRRSNYTLHEIAAMLEKKR